MCRRDKENCHECRYCCTLSVCTTEEGNAFKFSSDDAPPFKLGKDEGFDDGSKDAAWGFSNDARLYKNYDFRCLKPKAGVPIEDWPHYEMKGFRAAKSKQELEEVEEIPFDKYFFNFEDPQVLKAMTDGTEKALSLWRKAYGFDWADFTQGRGHEVKLRKLYQHCLEAEYGDFAQQCKGDGGVFKCCTYS